MPDDVFTAEIAENAEMNVNEINEQIIGAVGSSSNFLNDLCDLSVLCGGSNVFHWSRSGTSARWKSRGVT